MTSPISHQKSAMKFESAMTILVGIGSSAHMTGEMFRSRAGVVIVHVPNQGAPQANTDVIAGHVMAIVEAAAGDGDLVLSHDVGGLPFDRDVDEIRTAGLTPLPGRLVRAPRIAEAISTGWTLLLEELGLEHRDVQQVLLAGSFGSYLSPASAVRIGLVPQLPVLRIVAAGNVAGEGAKMALLSRRERQGAEVLLEEVRYVELSDRPDFQDAFVDQLGF